MIKYVMANIQMPIEVGPTGNITPLSEYIKIEILPCHELPEIDPALNNGSIMQQINQAIQEQYGDDDANSADDDNSTNSSDNESCHLTVSIDDLSKPRQQKPRQNMTFKSKQKARHSYTMKSRRFISSSNKDVERFQSQEVRAQTQEDGQSHSSSEQGSNQA